jgi:tetratricopeptide (TPR) repeat protein
MTTTGLRKEHRNADLAIALQHHRDGRMDDAANLYRQLHAADRQDSDVIFLMGVLCCDLAAFEPACQFLDEALALAPDFPEARRQWLIALNGLADSHISAGRAADAQRVLDQAREWAPDDPTTRRNLGRVALLREDFETARTRLEACIALGGEHAETLNWLGLAHLRSAEYSAAEVSLRQALRLLPEFNQARNNLGLALHNQGRLEEALACFEEVLSRDPLYQKARINLASTLRVLGRHARAQHELETVLAEQPDSVDALNNLGAVLQDLGQTRRALQTLTRAAELAPEVAQVRWNLALSQLVSGDFKKGWENFESRWTGCDTLRGGYPLPMQRAWQGESLQGRHLLLWAEQGFGDTVQFIRFARDIAARGAHVSVLAQPQLAELLGSAPGVREVIAQGSDLPAYDYHCPLMSLPHRLGVSATPTELHGETAYLTPAAGRVEEWRTRLRADCLKVGLVWAGSGRRQNPQLSAIDARRSISPERLAPLLSVPGCSIVSLQKSMGTASAKTYPLGTRIQDFSDEWRDFSDTAAVIFNLDLVISVDTAVAHLAGALGKPVWLLNRFDTCWRWMLDRSDSPWYSSLRLFRQPRPGDWESVVAAATAALAELAASHRPPR